MTLAKEFFTGGRAVFTVDSQGAGFPEATDKAPRRYTYKINKKKCDDGRDIFFVGVLTGPENTMDYQYLGCLDDKTGCVRLTQASKSSEESTVYRAANWALRHIWADRELPDPYRVMHEGRCGVCGRALTVPESIETGIGPVCAARMN